MARLKISFANADVGYEFRRRSQVDASRIRTTMENTAKWAANEILSRGRADISRAGRFGARWTEGLHADVVAGKDTIRIGVSHDVPYFMIYETGGIVKGAPLLWVAAPWAGDAQNLGTPRNYPGALVRVVRKTGGAPLLVSPANKSVEFIGLESVRIPKKFTLLEIIQDVASQIKSHYETAEG